MDENEIKQIIKQKTTFNVVDINGFSEKSYPKVYMQYFFNYILSLRNDGIVSKSQEYILRYTNEVGVNASTFTDNGNHYIVINFDAIVKVHDQFLRLFCLPNVFENVGANKSCKLIIGDDPIVTDKVIMFQNAPFDDDRQELAKSMSHYSVIFLLLHELGHQLNGHVDLIKKRSKSINGHYIKLDECDLQTLEMDADAFAATQLMDTLYHVYKSGKVFKTIDDMLLRLAYAITILFVLIEDYENNERKAIKFPKYIRMSLAIDSASVACKSICGMDYNTAADKLTKYSVDVLYKLQLLDKFQQSIARSECVEDIFDFIGREDFENKMQSEISSSLLSREIKDHSRHVLDNWKNLKSSLQKYTLVKLAE